MPKKAKQADRRITIIGAAGAKAPPVRAVRESSKVAPIDLGATAEAQPYYNGTKQVTSGDQCSHLGPYEIGLAFKGGKQGSEEI
jgi:hypothetical protein